MAANFFWTFLLLTGVCFVLGGIAALADLVEKVKKREKSVRLWSFLFSGFGTLTIASAIWWIWS